MKCSLCSVTMKSKSDQGLLRYFCEIKHRDFNHYERYYDLDDNRYFKKLNIEKAYVDNYFLVLEHKTPLFRIHLYTPNKKLYYFDNYKLLYRSSNIIKFNENILSTINTILMLS